MVIAAFDPRLIIRLTGPAVGPGWLAARDVAELARLLDQALIQIGRVLSRAAPRSLRPSAQDIQKLCRPYLVSWEAGSALAGFDLMPPPPTIQNFRQLGEASLHALLDGLAVIVSDTTESEVQGRLNQEILEYSVKLGNLLEHGIATITFTERFEEKAKVFTYDGWVRERVQTLALSSKFVEGTTRVVDFLRDKGQLRRATTHGGRPTILRSATTALGSFWRSATVEELAADQGVLPVSNLEELRVEWSEGDLFEDALSDVLRDRAERRSREERSAE